MKDMKVIDEKDMGFIEDVIGALKRIDEKDCTNEVYETIGACIEDLLTIIDAYARSAARQDYWRSGVAEKTAPQEYIHRQNLEIYF